MSEILRFFPAGLTPRPVQRDLLLELERKWSSADLFVITAPTATGKSEIAYTLAHWRAAHKETCNILHPDTALVDQFQSRYPMVQTLKRKDSYLDSGRFAAARVAAKKAGVRSCNYHVCFANKIAATTHVIDEAHKLQDLLEDQHEIRLWQREFPFPDDLMRVSDVVEWAQRYSRELASTDQEKLQRRLARAIKDTVAVSSDAEVRYDTDLYRGKVCKVLRVIPGLSRKPPDWLWPKGTTRKLVFLSATISREDIRELGLDKRKVLFLECPSPIPAAQRPVIYRPWVNMGRQYQEHAMPEFARRLRHELDTRPGKGLVHLPYALAEWLHTLLGDHPRLMWHDKLDKMDALSRFRESPPEQGKVLVASGMYEGIDLPMDQARWQVIGKVPYLSLGDDKVRKRMEAYPDWYAWTAIRSIVQAAGRIVRTPDDQGETLIWDINFKRLWDDDARRAQPLFPRFFADAVSILGR